LRECDVLCVDTVKGVFSVRSSLQNSRFHEVNLAEPKCTACEQWGKFHYPCKHFFGVFKFFANEWNFDSLPSQYRNSVFIALDNDHLAVASKLNESAPSNPNVDDKLSKEACQGPTAVDEGDFADAERSEKGRQKFGSRERDVEKVRISLRKALQEKQSVSVDDTSVLQNALDTLENVVRSLS